MEQESQSTPPPTQDQSPSTRLKPTGLFGIFFVGLVVLLTFFLGFEIGRNDTLDAPRSIPLGTEYFTNTDGTGEIDFSLFWDTWTLLTEKYVDRQNVDAQDLFYGAIDGMMRATGDPYTSFLAPEQFQALNEELNGSFEGIGAEIDIRDNILTIIAPLADSPAEKAGLIAGDRILEIDDESTIDITIEGAVEKIRGPRGTTVVFQVFRDGEDATRDIPIERDRIDVDSIRMELLEEGRVAHIRITQFGEDTATELVRAGRTIRNNPGVTGLVIDLRNNPGGLLNIAIDTASILLRNKEVVVIEEDANGRQKKIFTNGTAATGRGLLANYPAVILINQGSASASEILAGALNDHRDDIEIVGETSFGKGSVQELVPLRDNAAAKITTARWLTPNGAQINEIGITPDYEVELTVEDFKNNYDPQRDKAIEVLKTKL